MSTVYLTPDKLEDYFIKYAEILREKGHSEDEIIAKMQKQAKDNVVMTYTKEWMDENLNYWISIIQEQPGGYWIVQELIHKPHCEYEHYRMKNQMSYEKGNVGDQTARRELTVRNYNVYKLSQRMKAKEYKVTSEVYVRTENQEDL